MDIEPMSVWYWYFFNSQYFVRISIVLSICVKMSTLCPSFLNLSRRPSNTYIFPLLLTMSSSVIVSNCYSLNMYGWLHTFFSCTIMLASLTVSFEAYFSAVWLRSITYFMYCSCIFAIPTCRIYSVFVGSDFSTTEDSLLSMYGLMLLIMFCIFYSIESALLYCRFWPT